ncbi:hypothetical protein X729_24900 [Mesorhizobium sp. L103C131B0]|nr:hypothetical protein X729_24900 [Mesorhizobium sp. L103C131B0]
MDACPYTKAARQAGRASGAGSLADPVEFMVLVRHAGMAMTEAGWHFEPPG